MKYTIDEKSNKTIYMQLYEQLKKDIINNIYPYNSKLPSKRTLAEENETIKENLSKIKQNMQKQLNIEVMNVRFDAV